MPGTICIAGQGHDAIKPNVSLLHLCPLPCDPISLLVPFLDYWGMGVRLTSH